MGDLGQDYNDRRANKRGCNPDHFLTFSATGSSSGGSTSRPTNTIASSSGASSLIPQTTWPVPTAGGSLRRTASSLPVQPTLPNPTESVRFTRPPPGCLSDIVARSYRGKWRQRCEDLFKREEHFNYDDHFEADNRFDTDNRFDVDSSFDTDDSAHADGAFEADDFFNANGFYDTNDSDGKADHYSLKFPTVTALGFMDIPWPVQIPSCSKESVLANITEGDINPENVRSFLSALAGDEGVDELKVFNEALWYFCPERFDTQILPRIYDSHRCVVQDGVETVWRTLNDIFAHSDSSELILLEAELGEYSHWSTSLRDPNPPTKLPYL